MQDFISAPKLRNAKGIYRRLAADSKAVVGMVKPDHRVAYQGSLSPIPATLPLPEGGKALSADNATATVREQPPPFPDRDWYQNLNEPITPKVRGGFSVFHGTPVSALGLKPCRIVSLFSILRT